MKELISSVKSQLVIIDKTTDWMKLECLMEKQIEIRAELKRAIKRLDKELNNGK